MKFTYILSSISLLIGIASAKAIEYNNNDIQINNGYTELVETKKFKYNFNCLEDNNGICAKFRKDINSALSILENTFEIYQPIVFDVYIDDMKKIGLSDVSGANADTNFVPLRLSNDTNSPLYLFPQSLAKQLNLNKEPNYKDIDFKIIINNMKDENITEETNMDALLLHEIVHALGFSSYINLRLLPNSDDTISFIPDSELITDMNNAKLVPEFFLFLDLKTFNAESSEEFMAQTATSKISFYPLTIFEKNIVDIKTKKEIFNEISDYFRDFENCFGKDTLYMDITNNNFNNCYNNLNPEKQQLLSSITKDYLLKENSIGFLTNNGNVVPLQTMEGEFSYGSSICHTSYVDRSLFIEGTKDYCELVAGTLIMNEEKIYKFYDENFLMNYAGDNIPRELLYKTVAKNNKHGLMGTGIVDIMKTIGWTEKDESKNTTQYYLAEDVEIPEQNLLKYINTLSKFMGQGEPEEPEVLEEPEEPEEPKNICSAYFNNNNSDNNKKDDSDVNIESDTEFEINNNNLVNNTDSDSDSDVEEK